MKINTNKDILKLFVIISFGVFALRENPLFLSWNSSADQQFCLTSRFDYPYLKKRIYYYFLPL